MELEGEIWRLAQIIDGMQGWERASNWWIMLGNESPLLIEITGITIPKDFCFLDLKFSGKSNPLVHIECFNDMIGI